MREQDPQRDSGRTRGKESEKRAGERERKCREEGREGGGGKRRERKEIKKERKRLK